MYSTFLTVSGGGSVRNWVTTLASKERAEGIPSVLVACVWEPRGGKTNLKAVRPSVDEGA